MEFERGLNVLTGETGAGKSILVGALSLVLGERADRNMIRAGESHCSVEAAFQLADSSDVDAVLEELSVEPCEEGRLILRRTVSESGGGKILVNDHPVTLHALKRIGDLLVDMHGPHEHQSLLSADFQTDLLDSFGHLWKFRSAYEELYQRKLTQLAQRMTLEGGTENLSAQLELLSYQVKELTEAAIREGEEEELEREHSILANAQRIADLGTAVHNALTEDEHSAFSALASARNLLLQMADVLAEAGSWSKEIESLTVQVQELSDTVQRLLETVEYDPQRLQWLEERMALIHRLKRKYGGTMAALLDAQKQAAARLEELQNRGQRLAALDAELAATGTQLLAAAERLSEERRKAACGLEEAITAQLRDLGFPHGSFKISVSDREPGPNGANTIEFNFAPNLGEPLRPLRAIASSGEISRVMLAAKTVLAAHDRIPILVFDEIDANVGGELGNAVGAKLTQVAQTHQIICITHLTQVAVHGSAHYLVTKEAHEGRTRTLLRRLSHEERIEEIARMLGGKDITTVALQHARELLGGAQRERPAFAARKDRQKERNSQR